jgi:hypothetical protein
MATRNKYTIKGRIIDIKTEKGIAGSRVEAWGRDLSIAEPIASTQTDRRGSFQMEIPRSFLSKLFMDRMPELYFKVYYRDKNLSSSGEIVLWNPKMGEKEIIVGVDLLEINDFTKCKIRPN